MLTAEDARSITVPGKKKRTKNFESIKKNFLNGIERNITIAAQRGMKECIYIVPNPGSQLLSGGGGYEIDEMTKVLRSTLKKNGYKTKIDEENPSKIIVSWKSGGESSKKSKKKKNSGDDQDLHIQSTEDIREEILRRIANNQ